jgi:hypothetical protein
MGRAIGAVEVTPVAIAADDHLGSAAWVRAQEKPGLRQMIMLATDALVMCQSMLWTRAAAVATIPLQSCLCTV